MSIRSYRLARLSSALLLISLLAACGAVAQQSSPAPAPAARQESAAQAQPLLAIQPSGHQSMPTAAMAPTAAPAHEQIPATPNASSALATPEQNSDEKREPTPVAPQPVAINPFVRTTDDALSTFAIDVDTASYTAARDYLTAGQLPPADTVRIEEFVNYFHYDYPAPAQDAFSINVDSAPAPFGNPNAQIVRVGIQGRRIEPAQRAPAMLTFVIDISGSMVEPERLPLVKQALGLLVNELREDDQVGIVAYGSSAFIVLEPTPASQRESIIQAINGLQNEGSTNAEAGLQLGYQLASKHFKPGTTNRVILCSDGVANVGATGPDAIRKSIRDYTAQGIYLTTVGFGMGDYNDYLMEQLADDGNGNYVHVDTLEAARRAFVEELTGTLQVIAKDTKIQVEFNPAVVSRYRLLGYENRAVADTDFRNDQVDAGEVGAGHSVTALYEVVPTEQGQGTALTVRLRYAEPQGGAVHEQEHVFGSQAFGSNLAAAAPHLQLAVVAAGFAEQLRGGADSNAYNLDDMLVIAERMAPQLANDKDAQELVRLIARAQELKR